MVLSPPYSTQRPFVEIDEVMAGSPAEEAGLQPGDQLCGFADVSMEGPKA